MAAKSKTRLGIQSVEVAARILRALATAGRSLPLKDLARAAGMHPGKVHRYLVSLTRSELVAQDEASGHYGIGSASIELGLAGLRSVNVVRSATALLPAVRDEINETVLLAMWSPQGPVVFALEESSRPVTMNIRVGSILPLLSTATGRVFASFLPSDEVSKLLDAEMKVSRGEKPVDVQKLLDETRRNGLGRVSGDLVPGVNALAVPIFDHRDRIVGVIGALGRIEELDVDYKGAVATALLRGAGEISRRLGRPAADAQ
jgi:DNA-binding IclR family transcriptional regulator